MARVVGDGDMVEESEAEMRAFFEEPGRVHFVTMAIREGASGCLQTLEHSHFKPSTPRNDLFHLRYINWCELDWFIVSIPEDDKIKMERAAAANGLRVAQGIPTIINSGGIKQFPVRGPKVFALENIPGHPVYGMRR